MVNQNEALNPCNIQMLSLILSENQSHRCIHLAKEKGIKGGMVMIGRGTVSSAILNLLGIKSQRKEIVNFMLKKEQAEEIMDFFDETLQLSKPGHGIAYTTQVICAVGLPEQGKFSKPIAVNGVNHTEGKRMFKKLTVIVDRGMSDDVMEVARKAGVRGGTILHGRGTGAEFAAKLFGVEIEPEKELVIILTPSELTDKVVNELTIGLQLDEPGKGILFIEPILETRGLLELNDRNQ